MKVKCEECWPVAGRPCGRPARWVVGLPGYGGYFACDRCSKFWAPHCRRPLTRNKRRPKAA